jgi:hypothetical protein
MDKGHVTDKRMAKDKKRERFMSFFQCLHQGDGVPQQVVVGIKGPMI